MEAAISALALGSTAIKKRTLDIGECLAQNWVFLLHLLLSWPHRLLKRTNKFSKEFFPASGKRLGKEKRGRWNVGLQCICKHVVTPHICLDIQVTTGD